MSEDRDALARRMLALAELWDEKALELDGLPLESARGRAAGTLMAAAYVALARQLRTVLACSCDPSKGESHAKEQE